jgi:hypothetical protein
MAQLEKCARAACSCSVPPGNPFGKYCSEPCKSAGNNLTELHCTCHHPDCR